MSSLNTLVPLGFLLLAVTVGLVGRIASKHIRNGDDRRIFVFLLTFFDYFTNSDSPELRNRKCKDR